VVLTADHGVAPMPETLERLHPAAAPGWIVFHSPPMIYLNRRALVAGHVALEPAQRAAQAAVQAVPGVHAVETGLELAALRDGDLESAPVRSFHPARGGDLYYELEPYWLADVGTTGTDHGSVWRYDQNVPLLWFGRGIAPGVHRDPAAVTDIAPTLSALLGLAMPGGAQGRVLGELLR
jgi:arylsulfatase A-like enzyme